MAFQKSRLSDPNLWLLIAINIWSIIYYQRNPTAFNTIIWLYWFQSVLIGIFNFMDMITLPKIQKGTGEKIDYFFGSRGCSSLFFLFHYNAFHLAYAIFILANGKAIDSQFLLLGISAFTVNLLIQFVQHKKMQRNTAVNFSKMFFLPYLRIIPMHLMILAPIFLHLQPSIVFLGLKTIADIAMYLIITFRQPVPHSITNNLP